jgi:ATP-dependent Clp protease protease subunit
MNLFLSLLLPCVVASNVITLSNKNHVSLVGPVTSANVDSVLLLFNDPEVLSTMRDEKHIFLYLNTPGGSVLDGYRLIQHIHALQAQQVSVECIGQNFMSMGFAIFQTCTKRFVMSNSLGMQHPMSTTMHGSLQTIRTELDMLEAMYEELSHLQYTRMNITHTVFNDRILRDWWIFGQALLTNKVADEVVHVQCAPEVSNLFVRRTEKIMGLTFGIQYNKCPLINSIHTDEKNMSAYFDTAMYRENLGTILRDTRPFRSI